MQVITRKEAKALWLKRYYTGKPCPHGHVAERLVSNFGCVVCHVGKVGRWRAGNAEKQHDTYQIWYFKNRKKKNTQSLEWSHVNKKRHLQNSKDWRNAFPEKRRANEHKRRARKAGAEGFYTDIDVQQLYYDQGGLCLCGTPLYPHTIDHKTPLVRGGSNWPDNIQLLCLPCNSSKGSKTMGEWRSHVAS